MSDPGPQDDPQRDHGKYCSIAKVIFYLLIGLLLGFMIAAMASETVVSRELGRTSNCQDNFRTIERGISRYRQIHAGSIPTSLQHLVTEGLVSPKQLACPALPQPATATTESSAMGSHCDYIYIGGIPENAPKHMLVATELPSNHLQRGCLYLTNSNEDPFTAYYEFGPLLIEWQATNDFLAILRPGKAMP